MCFAPKGILRRAKGVNTFKHCPTRRNEREFVANGFRFIARAARSSMLVEVTHGKLNVMAQRGHATRSAHLHLFQEFSTLGQQLAHTLSLRQGLSAAAALERDEVRGRKASSVLRLRTCLYWVRHSIDNLGVSTIDTISYALFVMAIFHALLVVFAIRYVEVVLRAKPTLPAHSKNTVGR
jgi:hypothetical protein